MNKWFEKWPDWLKIPLKILIPAITILSGFCSFYNGNILPNKLYQFIEDNKSIMFTIFIACISLISAYVIVWISEILINYLKKKIDFIKRYNKFKNMEDKYKIFIIRGYINNNCDISISSSECAYFLQYDAIILSKSRKMFNTYEYALRDWMEECIKKYLKKLDKKIKKSKDLNLKRKFEQEKELYNTKIPEKDYYDYA